MRGVISQVLVGWALIFSIEGRELVSENFFPTFLQSNHAQSQSAAAESATADLLAVASSSQRRIRSLALIEGQRLEVEDEDDDLNAISCALITGDCVSCAKAPACAFCPSAGICIDSRGPCGEGEAIGWHWHCPDHVRWWVILIVILLILFSIGSLLACALRFLCCCCE